MALCCNTVTQMFRSSLLALLPKCLSFAHSHCCLRNWSYLSIPSRRERQLQETVSRAAALNEASRQHAINVGRLKEAKRENAMLKQMHAQAVADQRRRQYNFLRTQGAALHNERVALTKDYIRMSDYFEEVTDDDDVVEDEDDNDISILDAEFDEQKEDEDEDYTEGSAQDNEDDDDGLLQSTSSNRAYGQGEYLDANEADQDEWSNAVNIGRSGDEESFAESFQTRGSSTGTGRGAGGNWDLGRNLLLSSYTFRFRRSATLAFTKSAPNDYA